MSNRSLIEINHDYTHDLGADFMLALVRYLCSADKRTAGELERWGVRVVGMRHHSDCFVVHEGTEGFPPLYLRPTRPVDTSGQSGGEG